MQRAGQTRLVIIARHLGQQQRLSRSIHGSVARVLRVRDEAARLDVVEDESDMVRWLRRAAHAWASDPWPES